jgi:hypothetical protein
MSRHARHFSTARERADRYRTGLTAEERELYDRYWKRVGGAFLTAIGAVALLGLMSELLAFVGLLVG